MTSEPAFIAALRALATSPAARGLADDAAVLDFGSEALVLTHDMMAQGVHWLPGQDAADVAWKLVAVNLSDLAAKGAEPQGVLLGYTLGDDDARFIAGLKQALEMFGVPLLGGDTVAAPSGGGTIAAPAGGGRTHGLTAIGRATHRPPPSRCGAKAGDEVWITGPVGAAMMGYEALRDGTAADSTAFRRPMPLLDAGRTLAPLVSAMMDVSDGLLLDATRLAQASGVTLALAADAVPVAAAVPANRRDAAMRWGDDYQLLFTLPANRPVPPGIVSKGAVRIGTVLPEGAEPLLLDGRPISGPAGYIHGA